MAVFIDFNAAVNALPILPISVSHSKLPVSAWVKDPWSSRKDTLSLFDLDFISFSHIGSSLYRSVCIVIIYERSCTLLSCWLIKIIRSQRCNCRLQLAFKVNRCQNNGAFGALGMVNLFPCTLAAQTRKYTDRYILTYSAQYTSCGAAAFGLQF